MYHVFDRFFVILTQINDSSIRLSTLVAAGTVEESTARANDRFVDCPLSIVACDRQIGIFSANMKTVRRNVSTSTHCSELTRERF